MTRRSEGSKISKNGWRQLWTALCYISGHIFCLRFSQSSIVFSSTYCLFRGKYFKMKTFLDLYKHLFVYVYTLTMHLSFISRIVEQFIIFIFCKDLFQLSSLLINLRDDVLNPNPLKGLTIIINFNLIQTSSFTFINCSRCLVQYS